MKYNFNTYPYYMEFAYKTIWELKELINNNQTSSQEIWEYFLARNEKYNTDLNAFLNITGSYKEKNNTPLL